MSRTDAPTSFQQASLCSDSYADRAGLDRLNALGSAGGVRETRKEE